MVVLEYLRPRRRYHLIDVARALGIAFIHYGFYALFTVLILALRILIKQDEFFPPSLFASGLWYYPIVAPMISASLHIAYAEIGSPHIRFLMWLHTVFGYIYLPVVALI